MSEIEKAKDWFKGRQKNLARSVIRYKLTKDGGQVPNDASLDASAEKVVEEANRILKSKGRDILSLAADRLARLGKK